MGKMRILLRRLRTLLWTALTLVTLLAAILVGVGKLLMPYSVRYQQQLETWLSREFQQPVKVESFSGEWKAFGPRISLEGVTLLGEEGSQPEIAIQHAALDIKPLYGLLPGRPFYSFRIIGADMELRRTADGRFELSGLGVGGRAGSGTGGFGGLSTVGEVLLEDSSLSFEDSVLDIHVQLTDVRGRLQLDGRNLATEMEASVTDERRTRVLGDFKATLLIGLDSEQRLARAQWHVKAGELMVSEISQQLPGHPLIPQSGWLNAELWGEWPEQGSQLMEGVVDLRESSFSAEPRSLRLDHLNTRFRWQMQARKTWRLDLSDMAIETNGHAWGTEHMSMERNIPGNLGLWISSDFIEMEFPLQLTQRVMDTYNTAWPRSMPRQARGAMHGVDLVLDSRWKLYLARGTFERTDVWDWDRWPAITGIHGTLDLLGGEGQLEFAGEQVRLDWPRNFRRPAIVDFPACSMEILWWDNKDWQVDARDCTLRNEDLEIHGRSRFARNEGRPGIDINLIIDRANIAELDDYWPESIMRPAVTSWLRRGLVAGRVDGGRFVVRGDMDDWPFRGREGQLEARLEVSEVDLDYVAAWPRATRMQGTVTFLGSSMDVEGSVGAIGGVPVQSLTGHLDDFREPLLELQYVADASLPEMLEFIRQTPLLDNVDLDLGQFAFSGEARTTGYLRAPLGAGGDPLQIDGALLLDGNGFTERLSGVQLHGISGALRYDREGVHGESLDARYRDNMAVLDLAADWDAEEVFRTRLRGHFGVRDLLPDALLEGEPLLGFVHGSADWEIGLSVAGAPDAETREVWLGMASDLVGIDLRYPAPLNKPADQAWPLRIRYPVRSGQPIFTIQAQDRAVLQFDVADGMARPRRASVHLGTGEADLPGNGLFSVGGTAEVFDLDSWMEVVIDRFRHDRGAGELRFERAELVARDLVFLNRMFPEVDVAVSLEDSVLSGRFSSELLAGILRYSQSEDGSHSLTAEMERMLLPEPVAEGMVMDTDPASLPEMHLYAKEFSYLGLELGETRIEAYPVLNGFHFNSVEATSPDLTFQARGDWIKDADGQRSDFDIVMTSESLGSLMSAMGISTVLQGGQTMLHYDAWWPGPPAAFALARLNGDLDFSVIGGNIRNADAGAGRMVGLLSIAALPRRLALDFRDVFGSGFSFDQASGTVNLENGTAHTDDMLLESTAATMAISGSSDLVNREFDYTLAVRPGVGQTLPVIGAIAGGPGGAAAGLALQGLFQKSLGDATEARYSITGKWAEPSVERITMASPPESEPLDE